MVDYHAHISVLSAGCTIISLSGGSKMVTGCRSRKHELQNLTEKLEPHLVEIKHLGESKL
jgi:hypothetical protein